MAESGKTQASYEEAYKKLRMSYLKRLENSLYAMQDILTQGQIGKLTRDDLLHAQHLAHGLAGSGSTFDFPEITEAGRKADVFLTNLLRVLPPETGEISEEGFKELEKPMLELYNACFMVVSTAS